MDPVYIQAAVTIVTTLCGYGAVRGKLNLIQRAVGVLQREVEIEKQQVIDLKEEVRVLKLVAHAHK